MYGIILFLISSSSTSPSPREPLRTFPIFTHFSEMISAEQTRYTRIAPDNGESQLSTYHYACAIYNISNKCISHGPEVPA